MILTWHIWSNTMFGKCWSKCWSRLNKSHGNCLNITSVLFPTWLGLTQGRAWVRFQMRFNSKMRFQIPLELTIVYNLFADSSFFFTQTQKISFYLYLLNNVDATNWLSLVSISRYQWLVSISRGKFLAVNRFLAVKCCATLKRFQIPIQRWCNKLIIMLHGTDFSRNNASALL